MTDELYISDFAYGFLYAESRRTLVEVQKTGETVYRQSFKDVPSDASEFREYEDYNLKFWYDEDEARWHCTAYDDELANIQLW